MYRTMQNARMRLLTGIAAAGVLVAFSLPANADSPTDSDVSAAVKTELIMDPTVMFNDIDVVSDAGIVTLTGAVSNVTARERAGRLATTVRGVRSVVNRIDVAPEVDRSADALERDVTDALLGDPAADSYEVEASADDSGTVTLTGTVDSWSERDLAGKVAGSVAGVTDVNNEIVVRYDQTRTDLEIRGDVMERLEWDTHIDATAVEVEVQDGVVTLSGTVASAAERARAMRDAWVVGVEDIAADDLETSDLLGQKWKRKRPAFVAEDKDIERAVEAAMIYDPRVSAFDIRVDVNHGVVALSGEVDNLKARSAAYDDAMSTIGVLRVQNNIKVKTTLEMADKEVEQSVEGAIERDAFLDQGGIDVDVRTGNARLTGTVDTYFDKGQAEDVTSRVLGVTAVTNDLHVDNMDNVYLYDPYVDDWRPHPHWYAFEPRDPGRTDNAIKDAIESQLWWSPFVDSDAIDVSVEKGVATLSGTVGDWAEREAAENNAFDGGAIWVRNELEIASN